MSVTARATLAAFGVIANMAVDLVGVSDSPPAWWLPVVIGSGLVALVLLTWTVWPRDTRAR